MPYFFLFELIAPVVEALGIVFIPLSYFLGILSIEFFITYLFVAIVFGVILSIGSLVIEEFLFNKYVKISEFFRLCLYALIENFFYRQMTVIFRLIAIFGFKKHRHSWGKIQRRDFREKKDELRKAIAKK